MSVFITVLYILACVLMFAIAVIVHEFGHFIVALKLGLRVEAFSVGFGPVLWHRTIKGVDYRLSAFPLGGYVMIPDLDPEGTKALEGGEKGPSSPRQTIAPWKQVVVSFAGPGMNLVLAVVLAFVLAAIPGARFGETVPLVTNVIEDGPAAKAGMQDGDLVLSVGGNAVSTWSEMMTEVQIAGERETEVKVRRGESELRLKVTPERDEVTGAYFMLAANTNGCGAAAWMPARNPWRQLEWDASSIGRVLKGLTTPKEASSTAKAIGGPVMIAEAIYRAMRRDAWDGIGFLRFLNVNLAIVNLLPLPVLDGGLILFALIALVFRRPLPEKFVKYLTMAFMVLLLALMGLLIWRDCRRSWKIHTYEPPVKEASDAAK